MMMIDGVQVDYDYDYDRNNSHERFEDLVLIGLR